MDPLNPCPLCGGEASLVEIRKDRSAFYCCCPACDKSTDEYGTPEAAADAWNNSGPQGLKDTYDRTLYALVMNPAATCWQLTWRLLLMTIFPLVMLPNAILSTDSFMWIAWLSVTVLCLAIGVPLFIRYDRRRRSYIRHLPEESKKANEKARLRAFILVLCIYLALFLIIFLPFALMQGLKS